MAANSLAEKDVQPTTYAPENLTAQTSFSPLSPFFNVYNRFARWRSDLDLPHPGVIENLQKEIKTTHLTTFLFDGAPADLTKSLSLNPMFQVTHSFALGSQTLPPSYNLFVGNLTWINQASLLVYTMEGMDTGFLNNITSHLRLSVQLELCI